MGVPYYTGRTRTLSFQVDIEVSATLVWGWNIVADGIRQNSGASSGIAPDYWFADNTAISVIESGAWSQDIPRVMIAVVPDGAVTQVPYGDGRSPDHGYPHATGQFNVYVLMPGAPIPQYSLPPIPFDSGTIGADPPTLVDTVWHTQVITAALTRNYRADLSEVLDPSTGRFYEVLTPGGTVTDTITWPAGSYDLPAGGSEIYGPATLNYGTIQASADQRYKGSALYYASPGSSSAADAQAQIDAFHNSGPLLSQGATVKYRPRWTSAGEASVNPDAAGWGIVTAPVPPRYGQTIATGSGGGQPIHAVTIQADLLCADGSPETVPTYVTASFCGGVATLGSPPADPNFHNPAAVSGWTVTKTIGGYQFSQNVQAINGTGSSAGSITGITSTTTTTTTPGNAAGYTDQQNAHYGEITRSACAYLYNESPQIAPISLGYRYGHAWDSIRLDQVGNLDLFAPPFALASTSGGSGAANPKQWLWQTDFGTDGGSGPSPLSLNGANQLSIAVPSGAGPHACAVAYLAQGHSLTRVDRYLTITARSVGSGGQPLTIYLWRDGVNVGQVLKGAMTTGADGVFVSATFDLLDPANNDKLGVSGGGNPGFLPHEGVRYVGISGLTPGATYEISEIKILHLESINLSFIPAKAPGSNPDVFVSAFSDGVPTLLKISNAGGLGTLSARVDDFNGVTGSLYGVPSMWSATDLAPASPSGKTPFGPSAPYPASTLPQNDQSQMYLAGQGIIDTSSDSTGNYVVQWDIPALSPDGHTHATSAGSLTVPAQIVLPVVNFYPGCGQLAPGGSYGYSTTLRFSGLVRAGVVATVWPQATSPAHLVVSIDAAGSGTPPLLTGIPDAGGYVIPAGQGIRTKYDTASPTDPNGQQTADVTTDAGLSATEAFDFYFDYGNTEHPTVTALAPLTNALPGGAGGGAAPGGMQYKIAVAGTRTCVVLYAMGLARHGLSCDVSATARVCRAYVSGGTIRLGFAQDVSGAMWSDRDTGIPGTTPCVRYDRSAASGVILLTYQTGSGSGGGGGAIVQQKTTNEGQSWTVAQTIFAGTTYKYPTLAVSPTGVRHHFAVSGGAVKGVVLDAQDNVVIAEFTAVSSGVGDDAIAAYWRDGKVYLLYHETSGNIVKVSSTDARTFA